MVIARCASSAWVSVLCQYYFAHVTFLDFMSPESERLQSFSLYVCPILFSTSRPITDQLLVALTLPEESAACSAVCITNAVVGDAAFVELETCGFCDKPCDFVFQDVSE